MNFYESIDIPIKIGKNELSPECAYFLGAIMSADESFVFEGKRYWLAPVRHNHGQATDEELREHMQILQQIIGRANGEILTRSELKEKRWFNSNVVMRAFTTKQGFTAIFGSDENTTIDSFFNDIKTAMDNSVQEVKQAFIAGAFDGRSSIDRNMNANKIRYLVLDCENQRVANYLGELLDALGIEFNYNTARERLEGGIPRKEQFRIKGYYMPLFMEYIGLVSPCKFELMRSMLDSNLAVHIDNRLLWGLKTLSATPQVGEAFELLTPFVQKVEDDLDDQLLEFTSKHNAYTIHHFTGDPDFSYSGTPQEKAALINVNGRQTYRRDRKVALNALMVAENKCEIDRNHPTFIRKNSNLPYSEPHHFVPVAFHEMFPVSLDVEENIISLCSNCHNQLHYGKDIKALLTIIYETRKNLLRSAGIDVSLKELFKMYNT